MPHREKFIAGESRMGHFRVVGEVGEGGMGSVFIGLDEKLGRRVALKVLRSELTAGLGFERFVQEIGLGDDFSVRLRERLHARLRSTDGG